MTKTLCAAAALLALQGGNVLASDDGRGVVCGTPRPSKGYPTFCSIPATPTDVRSAGAFKSDVVDTRKAGRRLVQQTAAETFTLPSDDAARFSGDARAQAAPPAGADEPAGQDTQSFEAEARRRAAPPRKPHP